MAKFSRSSFLLIVCLISFSARAEFDEPWLSPQDHYRMASYGEMFVGSPYNIGARKPGSEDCSSLMIKIFSLMGIELARSARDQVKDTRFIEVPLKEIQTGDLVFFKNTYRKGISHVGYMTSAVEMLHASSSAGVRHDRLTPRNKLWKKIHSVRRWRFTASDEDSKPRFSWNDK